jgi:hypothetical protein
MSDTGEVLEWLAAFVLTQAIEMPIYARVLPGPRRWVKAFGASAITHPVVWWGFAPHWPWGYVSMLAAAETFAVVVEAVYLHALGTRRALLWSLIANAGSAGAGLLIYALTRPQ